MGGHPAVVRLWPGRRGRILATLAAGAGAGAARHDRQHRAVPRPTRQGSQHQRAAPACPSGGGGGGGGGGTDQRGLGGDGAGA